MSKILSKLRPNAASVIFCSLILFFAAILLDLHAILPSKRPISCLDLKDVEVGALRPGVECFRRHWIVGKYDTIVLDNRHSETPVLVPLHFRSPAKERILYGQSIRDPNSVDLLSPITNKKIGGSYGTATLWSAASRVKSIVPGALAGLNVRVNDTWGPYELIPAVENISSPLVSELDATLPPPDSQTHWIVGISLFVLAGLSFLNATYRKTTLAWVTCLSCLFFSLTLLCGMPYGSTTGWYDPGDDKSYVQWTYNLGYLLDPFLYHSNHHSWAQSWNHHQWGTGLLLAPFVTITRIFGTDIGTGGIFLTFMSLGVVLLTFLSLLIYFFAFKRIASASAAAIASFGTLCCTSLLKWTYMRNFFSHAPEAFALSVGTYGVVGRFFASKSRRFDQTLMLVGLFTAIQVRRENLGFCVLLVLFEILSSQDGKLVRRWHDLNERWTGIVAILSVTALGEFSLRLTNYFTDIRHFKAPTPNSGYFHFDQLGAMFYKNFFEIVLSESSGQFYWKNLFAILPAIFVVLNLRKWRIWLPMVLTVCMFLTMCICYEYPTGFEWQNRFNLKLNPLFFGTVAVMICSAKKPIQWLGITSLMFSAYFELSQYWMQLPKGMAFYINEFGDHSLLYPQTFHGLSVYRFYMPLFVLLGLLTTLTAILQVKDARSAAKKNLAVKT